MQQVVVGDLQVFSVASSGSGVRGWHEVEGIDGVGSGVLEERCKLPAECGTQNCGRKRFIAF